MKKVLSLVLAVVLVLGMSSMAFAASYFGGNEAGHNVNLGTLDQGDTYDEVITLTNALTDGALGPGTIGDVLALTNNSVSISGLTISRVEVTGLSEVTITFAVSATAGTGIKTGNYSIATNGGTISGTINVTIAGGGGGATSIPSYVEIDGISNNWDAYLNNWNDGDFDPTGGNEVFPDKTAKIKLRPGMFTWKLTKDVAGVGNKGDEWTPPAAIIGDASAMRTSHVKNVDVRKTNPTNNSGTIKSVKLDGLTVKITLVEYFLKCGKTDVSCDLTLTHKSKASDTKVGIDFTIKNQEEFIEDGQAYVYTDGHVYVHAEDASVRNIEMILSDNLSLFKSFGKSQKAYANVSLELSAGDEALFHKFAELSDVYTLYTVGVNSANVTAKFNDLGDTYFVYDENYKLVGTTADTKLPFSNKYYLTTKKVDLAGTDATELPADEDSSSTAPTGDTGNAGTGGGTVSAPTNYNPNTGC